MPHPEAEYSVPLAKRVLVLTPHPDDETLGCGGTIALYVLNGAEVHSAIISDGGKISNEFTDEEINIVAIRKKESLAAAKILGIQQTHFLGYPDGELRKYKDEIQQKLEDIIEEFNPDIIFSPSPTDYHDDHITTSAIAIELLNKKRGFKVAFYEVYGTVRFNYFVDISSVLELKRKAILSYHYSLFRTPEIFFEAIKGLNRFRSLFTRANKYYEAFWILPDYAEKNEILNWVTYGMRGEDAGEIFLSKLKSADHFLFELKKCNVALKEKEKETESLKVTAEKRGEKIDELERRLDRMTTSFIWRQAVKFYGARDRLLPEGSKMRKLYDALSKRVKFGTAKDKP